MYLIIKFKFPNSRYHKNMFPNIGTSMTNAQKVNLIKQWRAKIGYISLIIWNFRTSYGNCHAGFLRTVVHTKANKPCYLYVFILEEINQPCCNYKSIYMSFVCGSSHETFLPSSYGYNNISYGERKTCFNVFLAYARLLIVTMARRWCTFVNMIHWQRSASYQKMPSGERFFFRQSSSNRQRTNAHVCKPIRQRHES